MSVATEFLHQDMWSGVRVGNLFPHTQLVPVEYSMRLGRAVYPMMLLASEPGFHVRSRLSCVCHLPRGKCSLFLFVCNSSIQKPDTAGPQVSHPFLEICWTWFLQVFQGQETRIHTVLCFMTLGPLSAFTECQFSQLLLAGVAFRGSRVSPGLVRRHVGCCGTAVLSLKLEARV